MTRRYYSSRKRPGNLSLDDLYVKLQNLFLLFRDQSYFEQSGISENDYADSIKYEAALVLTFQPFPITKWTPGEVTEEHIFDTLEFLYDLASKPGEQVRMRDDTGFDYWSREFDKKAGGTDLRTKANAFLAEYNAGYELTEEGEIVELGAHGLQHILNAEIISYDEENVDSKVRSAIYKWRNRNSTVQDKKEAIREVADVFEWLKKTKRLSGVLDKKDESALFDIANNFAIRHHDPKQKTKYDRGIWYAWIFHFYLATYHACIRLLTKPEKGKKGG
jgi:hypothetical protein